MRRTVFIWLSWRGTTVILPEIADSIRVEHGGAPNVHNIIGIGPLNAPSYMPNKTIIIENSQLNEKFMQRYVSGSWSPRQYADWLHDWRDSREYGRVVIESRYPNLIQNMLALIDFESWEARHDEEADLHYSLVMYEYEPHEIGILQQTPSDDVTQPPPPRPDERPPLPNPHTVVTGDTLIGIARKHGVDWRDIYNLNRDLIHQRGNQDLIFPGMNLQIP